MRNDLTACSGPQAANAAPSGRGRTRRRMVHSGLLALGLTLALIAPGATALATETTTTSGYSQTTPTPTTKTEPKQGTGPTKTSSTPSKETQPAKSSSEPTNTASKTLPFTGLDLRWMIVGGLLLVCVGTSVMVMQRRRQGTR